MSANTRARAFLLPLMDQGCAVMHWALRPVRALILAYRHVLAGEKVATPFHWKDI